MPHTPPTISRTPQHIRQVHYRSFERADGLWDIEGELLDTKAIDLPRPNGSGVRKAGDPIHHMRIRVTVDTQLVVQAIEASLEAHPVQGCPGALAGMQRIDTLLISLQRLIPFAHHRDHRRQCAHAPGSVRRDRREWDQTAHQSCLRVGEVGRRAAGDAGR